MMKKAAYFGLFIIVALALGFMIGPKAPEPHLNPNPISISVPIDSLDAWIAYRESGYKTMKPGNEAKIVWLNDSVQVAEYAVVYLHGLSASHEEGNPVHYDFAKRYGCNLFLPRLYAHGLDTVDALIDLTPENYLQSAKEAVAIGKTIGKKVILVCTSTGGTLGLYLTAHDPEITAIICYSPNIDIFDQNSKILTKPWGLQLARWVSGGNSRSYEASEEFKKYWQTNYRLEGLVATRSLIDHTMTDETFGKITQPVFVGCYYKDEQHQDEVVSVAAMQGMMPLLGTPINQKRMVEFANAEAHVITNPIRSKDVEGVEKETFKFAEDIIGLRRMSQ
ncbi:MAG: alpha/beta hydrolase [Flavobacteriales bacterium]|nr:alpha/beta hydrolase [Flavobacteriales bacterium]